MKRIIFSILTVFALSCSLSSMELEQLYSFVSYDDNIVIVKSKRIAYSLDQANDYCTYGIIFAGRLSKNTSQDMLVIIVPTSDEEMYVFKLKSEIYFKVIKNEIPASEIKKNLECIKGNFYKKS